MGARRARGGSHAPVPHLPSDHLVLDKRLRRGIAFSPDPLLYLGLLDHRRVLRELLILRKASPYGADLALLLALVCGPRHLGSSTGQAHSLPHFADSLAPRHHDDRADDRSMDRQRALDSQLVPAHPRVVSRCDRAPGRPRRKPKSRTSPRDITVRSESCRFLQLDLRDKCKHCGIEPFRPLQGREMAYAMQCDELRARNAPPKIFGMLASDKFIMLAVHDRDRHANLRQIIC